MRAFSFRGASPRRAPLHTRSRGPQDPRSARVAHSHALVRATHICRSRAVVTAALVVTGASGTLFACPVCFGAEETALIDGAKLGILVLLGITFAVQGAFVGFFVYLRKRAKRIAEGDLDAEWSQLQRGPSRTS
jgi:hypothetical protein